MEHLLLKTTATAVDQDQGTFTAIISTATSDREGDVVDPQAMVAALQKWVPLGKNVPLAWNHSTAPDMQIGYIDPASVQAKGGEVEASGWIDRSIEAGQHAWRQVKAGTLGFSFGYLVPEGGATPRKGGGFHITALDVFEVTATTTPMNGDTRVVGWKGTDGEALFDEHELKAALAGDLKAVWTAAYINGLPDSSFLYIEPGGTKDDEGKTTPRSLRHFPVKDASGAVDLPHLRNALARIPQSNLSQSVKDEAAAKAQRMLDSNKSIEDARDEDPPAGKSEAQDRLRKRAHDLELEFTSAGISAHKSPRKVEQPKPELMPLAELKARMRDETLALLSGGISDEQV